MLTTSAAALLLSSCAGDEGTLSAAGLPSSGAVELAISETCADTAVEGCVSTAGDSVTLPTDFERVGVTEAVAVDEGGQNAVGLTLSVDGATTLAAVTQRVADAGPDARLVVKIGDDLLSAVRVVDDVRTDFVVVALPSSENPDDVIDIIRNS